MDEHTLLQHGPSAVMEAVGGGADLNLHVLGQACGRKSRLAESVEAAEAWTEAAILCYERAATKIGDPTTQQSLTLGACGLRAAHVIRVKNPNEITARYLEDIRGWLHQGISHFASPDDCRRALDNLDNKEHHSAILASERLGIGLVLRRSGHFGSEFDVWFAATGLNSTLIAMT